MRRRGPHHGRNLGREKEFMRVAPDQLVSDYVLEPLSLCLRCLDLTGHTVQEREHLVVDGDKGLAQMVPIGRTTTGCRRSGTIEDPRASGR